MQGTGSVDGTRQPLAHALPVAAFPEHPSTRIAGRKPLLSLAHARRQPVEHVRALDRMQRRVAVEAARKRLQAGGQIEPGQYLGQLGVRLLRVDVAAVRQVAAHQQAAVATEGDAPFGDGGADELPVPDTVFVSRIKAGQAEQAGERPQMGIGEEARHAQRRRPQAKQRRHVKGLEHRIDRDAVAVVQTVREIDRRAVDQNQLDLGVRYAERLERMLDRRVGGAGQHRLPAATVGGNEIVEFGVETEADGERRFPDHGRLGRRVRHPISVCWQTDEDGEREGRMTIGVEALAELIREIEREDPIDYGDLPYDEDDLRRLVCQHIHDISDQAEQLGSENRTTVLLAVAAKLVLENLVLHVRLLQSQGEPLEASAAALLRRLRGGRP